MSSTSLSLESYFYISCNQNGRPLPITLHRETSKEKDDKLKRILDVASSLAFICVRKPKDEIYAVAIDLSKDSAMIYLAENYGVPDTTLEYLTSVLAQLTAISRSQPAGRRDRSLDTIPETDEQTLGTMVLKHTFPKFFGSLTKRDSTWDARVEAIRRLLAESPDRLELFETVEEFLSLIYGEASFYHTDPSDTQLESLYDVISTLEEFIRRGDPADGLASLLEDIDRTTTYHWSADSDLVDGELDLDVDDDNVLHAGFSMARFVYRIISLKIHIRRLLRLAASPAFSSIFAKDLSIQCCPSTEISVHVDSEGLLRQLQLDNLVSEYVSGATVTGPLHAELCIFTTIIRLFLNDGIEPYWAIGVSKLMCRRFAVQGTHGKMDRPWVAPDLTFATTHLGFDLNAEIRQSSEDLLKSALTEYAENRRLSDSSIESAASDKKPSKGNLGERPRRTRRDLSLAQTQPEKARSAREKVVLQ
ncbi:hypothetical protein DXG03_002046 [Asterophora parasitica]|uniref:Uncharacterized protein n=1 Tax=Asterophora parasitica TaxID=117018 RepID=A0A9P7KBE9_9AGAR|nr:hypothetical protein DXG03_002046 [Asterophora parasitica]